MCVCENAFEVCVGVFVCTCMFVCVYMCGYVRAGVYACVVLCVCMLYVNVGVYEQMYFHLRVFVCLYV